MQALVIINLSTMDAYTNAYGEERAARLAHAIYEKIAGFNGPVYVVDQKWIPTEDSYPRIALMRSIQPLMLQKDIRIVEFDEGYRDWSMFLKEFRAQLRDDDVTAIVLGGLWYDPESGAGAVGEAKKFMAPYISSMVDRKIVAMVPKGAASGRLRRN